MARMGCMAWGAMDSDIFSSAWAGVPPHAALSHSSTTIGPPGRRDTGGIFPPHLDGLHTTITGKPLPRHRRRRTMPVKTAEASWRASPA